MPARTGSPDPLRQPSAPLDRFACARMIGCPPLFRLFVIPGLIHVSQNQAARIDSAPLTRVDKVHTKFLDRVGHFSHAPRQRSRNRRTHSRRYTAASGSIPRSVCGMTASPCERSARESSQSSHSAERYGRSQATIKFQGNCVAARAAEIPARGPRRAHSVRPERARRFHPYRVQSKGRVSVRRSDHCNLGGDEFEQSCRVKNQRGAAEIKKPLVAAHARAGAPSKNERQRLGDSASRLSRACEGGKTTPGRRLIRRVKFG